MRVLLYALLLCGLLAGCSKKEESPAPAQPGYPVQTTGGGNNNSPQAPALTLSSGLQFWGEIDGQVKHFISGQGNYLAGTIKDQTVEADSTHARFELGILNPAANFTGISVTRGRVTFANGARINEGDFLGLFTKGKYPFSQNTEVNFYDDKGIRWGSALGAQNNSLFEFTDVVSTGTATAPVVKVLIKFSCKVYNSSDVTQSKQIKNAVMVGQFSAN